MPAAQDRPALPARDARSRRSAISSVGVKSVPKTFQLLAEARRSGSLLTRQLARLRPVVARLRIVERFAC